MNLCKIVYKHNVTSLANNLRNFSISSNSTLDRRRGGFLHRQQESFVNKPILSTIDNRRNLSIEAIVKWQEQTYMSISSSSLVSFMQDTLLYFHESTGLTWSATIITTTILVRALMTLPLSIYQSYILAKVENIGLELKDLVNELRKETAMAKKMYNLSDKQTVLIYRRSMKKQWKLLIERDNCHPLKATMLIWFQIPIWVCMSFALRNLTPIIASIYSTGRNERHFSKPNTFLPYRWDKNDPRITELVNHVPSATLPFAMGARSCIGKKIAMKQLTEFISEIINNFDFKCTNDKSINSITSQVLIPDRHIDLYLSVRK